MLKVLDDQQETLKATHHLPWLFPDVDGQRTDSNAFYKRWLTYRNQHRTHAIIMSPVLFISLPDAAVRPDSSGQHNNRSTGAYHYHHGLPAHQHINAKSWANLLYITIRVYFSVMLLTISTHLFIFCGLWYTVLTSLSVISAIFPFCL